MSAPATAGAAPTSVHVRMYRALLPSAADPGKKYNGMLGDCFLIRLANGDSRSHILIDCGLLLGSPDAKNRAVAIADDIAKTCGGRLDLVVVTHEHWDHISGFSYAESVFFDPDKLKIGKVWMAWTEDPDDVDAKALRAKFDKSGQAFAMIAQRLADEPIAGLNAGRALDGLQGFLGEPGTLVAAPASVGVPAEQAAATSGALAGRDILARLKSVAKTDYLAPIKADRTTTAGNVTQTPGDVSLRTYVLGPPREWTRLSKDKPSSGADMQETYLDTPSLGQALLGFAGGDDQLAAADGPFAPQFSRRKLAAFTTHGQAPPDDGDAAWLVERYFQPDIGRRWRFPASADARVKAEATAKRQAISDRRRIDGEWLASAGALAMKLDSDTNNTSLVLAFDLPGGDAMLFAADAQVGNWLSWHDQTYGEGESALDAASILQRVRFYKVGHHGSHNATLDKKGLALMTHPELVAAIPTDEELGRKQGRGGWQMPNPRVQTALMERTKGQILRNDRHYVDPSKRHDDLKAVKQEFFDLIDETEIYIDFKVL